MKIIVGLGNPGKKYERTRHNLGFYLVDSLREELNLPPWEKSIKFNSLISRDHNLILLKPQTYMNNSGQAVKALVNFFKVELSDLWVIHDDVDLALGRIKVQHQGTKSSTHKGIVSICQGLGRGNFPRFRLGVAGENYQRHKVPAEDYVLAGFSKEEIELLPKISSLGIEVITEALKVGIEKVQSQKVEAGKVAVILD